MSLSRRELLKAQAAAVAAAAAGMTVPAAAQPVRRRHRIAGDQMVEGAVPLLRHRLRGDGRRQGRQGRRDPRRHARRGQSRAELHQGIFPLQDHVWRRPPDHAAAAQEGWRLRQERRTDAGDVGRSLRRDGGPRQGGAEGQGPDRARHVRLGAMDGVRRLCRHQADAGRLSLQQSRSQCPPLHGVGGGRLHAHLRHGRADGLLRRFRGGGRVRAVGLEHGRDASDPVDASHRPALEPSACEGGGALDLHAPQLRSRRHPDRVQAGDGSGDPELYRQPHHHDRTGQPGLRQEPHHLREGHGRHRLRIARRIIRSRSKPRARRPPARRSRSTSTPMPPL